LQTEYLCCPYTNRRKEQEGSVAARGYNLLQYSPDTGKSLFTSLPTAETSPVTKLRKRRNKRITENVYNSGQETNFLGG
jgi:hypothetical protein